MKISIFPVDYLFSVLPDYIIRYFFIKYFKEFINIKSNDLNEISKKVFLDLGTKRSSFYNKDYNPPYIVISREKEKEFHSEESLRFRPTPLMVLKNLYGYGNEFLQGYEDLTDIDNLFVSMYEVDYSIRYTGLTIQPSNRYSTIAFKEKIQSLLFPGFLAFHIDNVTLRNIETNAQEVINLGNYNVNIKLDESAFNEEGNKIEFEQDKLDFKYYDFSIILHYHKFRTMNPLWIAEKLNINSNKEKVVQTWEIIKLDINIINNKSSFEIGGTYA